MSRRMTLKEIYDMIQSYNKENNVNYFLLGKADSFTTSFSFWEDYITNGKYLDKFQSDKRRNFLFCLDLDDTNALAIEEFHSSIAGFLYTYKDSLNKMYDALRAQYDPLDNMKRLERIDGSYDTVYENISGAQNIEFENGAQTSSSTSATSPWNEGESFTNTEKTDSSNGAYKDTQKVGQKLDSGNEQNHNASTRHISGNSGNNTLSNLVASEVNMRESIAFYDKLLEMLIRELFQFSDSGYDAFFIL